MQIEAAAVRAQVARIQATMQGKETLGKRLGILVEMALADRPEEDFKDWRTLELELFADDSDDADRVRGSAGVRQEVMRVKDALDDFYVNEAGPDDAIEIKITKGSRRPQFADRPLAEWGPLSSAERRLLGRGKLLAELRTPESLLLAQATMLEAITGKEVGDFHPVVGANAALVSCMAGLCAPLGAGLKGILEGVTPYSRARREPWESVFCRACLAAIQHDVGGALILFERAADESRGESRYLWWHSAALASLGRMGEAVEILSECLEGVGRTSIGNRCDLALLLVMLGRCGEADELLRDGTAIAGADDPILSLYRMLSLEAQDDLGGCLEILTSQVSLVKARGSMDVTHYWFWGMVMLVSGRLGKSARADAADYRQGSVAVFENALAAPANYGSVTLALGAIGIGEYDLAAELLREAAFEEHSPLAMWFHIFPPLRHLQGHPGFDGLLRELKLSPRFTVT